MLLSLFFLKKRINDYFYVKKKNEYVFIFFLCKEFYFLMNVKKKIKFE